jgi:sulfite reductase alpha subunit-like flavoprotein
LKYKPGDVLCVQPENLKENVESCLELLNLNGDSIIEISSTEDKFAFALPSWKHNLPCSVRNCVTKFIDLQAAPQRYALQILAHFTTSELERERLLEFCSPEGQEEFFDYCHRSRRTILEVLRDFPHATSALPVEYLFDVFRPIQPRSFSIASASEVILFKI